MEITVFSKENIGIVHALIIDNKPYYYAKDVDKIVKPYYHYDRILYERISSEDRKEICISGEQISVINLSGVCSFIDNAYHNYTYKYTFWAWFTDEILPVMVVKAAGMSPENVHALDAVKCYHYETL